jgi:hypothetical protein
MLNTTPAVGGIKAAVVHPLKDLILELKDMVTCMANRECRVMLIPLMQLLGPARDPRVVIRETLLLDTRRIWQLTRTAIIHRTPNTVKHHRLIPRVMQDMVVSPRLAMANEVTALGRTTVTITVVVDIEVIMVTLELRRTLVLLLDLYLFRLSHLLRSTIDLTKSLY